MTDARGSIRLRRATTGDGEAVSALLAALFAGASDVRAGVEQRERAYGRLFDSDRLLVLVAEDDAGLLGLISVSFNLALRYAGEYAQIEELIVDERARGTGLGARLVRAAIDAAQERGCLEIGLYAREETRAFYEKLGFGYRGPEVRLAL